MMDKVVTLTLNKKGALIKAPLSHTYSISHERP